MRVLLVEDDDSIAVPLVEGLGRFGIQAEHVTTGAAALAAPPADLVLLDLGLPDIDGVDVCWELNRTRNVPIIMLTSRRAEADLVRGLEGGADDYLAKPFSLRELVARIRAVDRRSRATRAAPPPSDTQALGPLSIDRAAREVSVDGRPVTLSPKEYDLLEMLAARPGTMVLRQKLLEQIWATTDSRSKTLDFHIASLRRKLGRPDWIETRRGVGFRLVVT
ncbi:DNA-binding response regulator [Paractinoplanes abujensis]|uniref:DNA-binding response OmpR family regulator n=1 Tax=Paractinoplanes abujensis TaxID=882441 RepID=A0A7W7D2V7_9ACTN|nr:response regulator transcription factor [Actinoplanes abujensis]MBB4697968.1 DNA-binding response OmpR family regulator [Actinoplanes abujensis]GID19549.1 DNA-binding response regulator [Actinoplanes abujensis]